MDNGDAQYGPSDSDNNAFLCKALFQRAQHTSLPALHLFLLGNHFGTSLPHLWWAENLMNKWRTGDWNKHFTSLPYSYIHLQALTRLALQRLESAVSPSIRYGRLWCILYADYALSFTTIGINSATNRILEHSFEITQVVSIYRLLRLYYFGYLLET